MERARRRVAARRRARRRACSSRSSARRASAGLTLGRRDGPLGILAPAMTHVFVAPHPDDVALSCGGLIASLRELGQNVTIITVFSGNGAAGGPHAVPARGARLRVARRSGR